MPGQRFAINLAPSTAYRAQFPLEVSRLLAKYAVEAWQLIFEVTESSAFGHADLAASTLRKLQKKMGIRIAIDDFGTGYASYARLKSVDADILKIDGGFIRNIVSNSLITRLWLLFAIWPDEENAGGGGICGNGRDT